MLSFDLRESIISFSLLEITYHFKKMRSGEVMEIWGADESTISRLKNMLPTNSYTIKWVEVENAPNPATKVEIIKS
jgi:TusA-related sulfurtransferase